MYVCVCNGLTSREIGEACAAVSSTGGVYRSLGVQPRCGKCVPTVRGMVAAARQGQHRELASDPASA